MKHLMSAVCGKPAVQRLTLTQLLDYAKRDGLKGYRLEKLGKLASQDMGAHHIEFPAGLAPQASISALWSAPGVRVLKSSGYPATDQNSNMLADALFLFQPSPNFAAVRYINQRYEGPDKTHKEFQGKFVADHVAVNYNDALRKMREREKRGTPPSIQTFIAADGAFDTFKLELRKLFAAGYFKSVHEWIERTKGDGRKDSTGHWAFKGWQVQSILYVVSAPLNMWEFLRNGPDTAAATGSAYTIPAAVPPAAAPATVQRLLVFAVSGDHKTVYHMEDAIAVGTTYTAAGMAKKFDAGRFCLDSGKRDRLPSILGVGVQIEVHMRFGRP